MKYAVQKLIRFHHCDAAGIVFYPQFFYLLHEVQEDFLRHIGFPQHELIASGKGLPVVDLKTEFLGMCRYGDEVTITLQLTKIGKASLGMYYEIEGQSQAPDKAAIVRLKAHGVVVYSEIPNGKAVRIPDGLRDALKPYLQLLQVPA